MRVAALLTGISGHFGTCLAALAHHNEVEMLVVCPRSADHAPFDLSQLDVGAASTDYVSGFPSGPDLLSSLEAFRPDVLLIVGWQVRPYRYVAKRLSPRPLRVLCMDNQWLATGKQFLGIATSRTYLHPLFDVVFLPGERQAVFAHKLGFSDSHIWRGLYSCDHDRFAAVHRSRDGRLDGLDRFLFVGRLVKSKGIPTLAAAYETYRSRVPNPWPLTVCGTGPLADHLRNLDGVEMIGFLQPAELPVEFARASCLVMPSLYEPWGVAVHEATAAGLAVICSTACGSSPHLVESGFNGYLVPAGDPTELAKAMARFSSLPPDTRRQMMIHSHGLSHRYTPRRWASTLFEGAREALGNRQW